MPTRVLHVIDTGGPGGAETVLKTVVKHLDRGAWQSRVIIPLRDWLSTQLEALQVETVVVPPQGGRDFGTLRELARQVRDFRPAVIHAHLLGAGVYGTLAAVLAGGPPVLCTLHGRPDVSPSDRLLQLKARILARDGNRVAYVSHDLRAYLDRLLGLPAHLGVVVHNGVDFPEPHSTGRAREECGAGPDDVLVGAVGNVRPAKDYATFLRAAAAVCQSQPRVRFAIVGDRQSPLTEPLVRMSNELGLDGRLRFLGFRDDAAALVKSFDLFVSSSRTEGLPLGTVEAVALGTPVVLTRVGGVPEVVVDGVTGRLVPAEDPSALAAGILAALSQPERTAEMAVAGAVDVRERFSAQRMCDSYQELYRRLAASPAGGATPPP